MTDRFGRRIDYLRLSVTELCQLRCIYCMPPEGVCKGPHGTTCSIEELTELAAACVRLGVRKIRLTGGEPLVRRGVLALVAQLRALPGLEELTMTTNGLLLPALASPLREAGLDRLNISLDSLRPERYRALSGGGDLNQALAGLAAAEQAGFDRIALNVVLLKGCNDDELRDLALLARDRPLSVRFIELMPMGPGAALSPAHWLPAQAVLEAVPELQEQDAEGRIPRSPRNDASEGPALPGGGVARLYAGPGWAGTVGLIAPMSHSFCHECNRIRITADGRLKPCLHSQGEFPLRGLHGAALEAAIAEAAAAKPARHHLAPDSPSDSARTMNRIGG